MFLRDKGNWIEGALEELPGFKSVSVLDFRPQKDTQGLDGMVADYAVTVQVDGVGVSAEQLNYLTLQSNLVESSYRQAKELPTVVYTISEVRDYGTEALHREQLEHVSESPESANTADGATVSVLVDELPEVFIQEGDSEDFSKEDLLSEHSDSEATVTTESDVIILEENVAASPASVLITSAQEPGSIEEEGLLLGDTEQPYILENPPPEEFSESATVPQPPVETETFGSGVGKVEDLLQPSSHASEDKVEIEVAAASEEPAEDMATMKEDQLDEVSLPGIPEETTGGEDLPALVPAPEAVDETSDLGSKASEPGDSMKEGAEEDLNLPDAPPADEDVNPGQPEDNSVVNVVLDYPEPFEESEIEEATEMEGQEVQELTASEVLVVEEVAQETPEISTEELEEDEILLVDNNAQSADTDSPAQPTALSPVTHISDTSLSIEGQPDIAVPSIVETQTSNMGLDDDTTVGDLGYDVVHYSYGVVQHAEDGSTGFPFGPEGDQHDLLRQSLQQEFLRVQSFGATLPRTVFSQLVPYLQSNLSNFENLEILSFRNGSIVVNSRMKFGKPVPRGVTTTVYLILEDFCNTAYQTMNLAIDKYSLDVESGGFCRLYIVTQMGLCSVCVSGVNNQGSVRCVDGLPCQSICELKTAFCLNDGKCDIIPGQGAICRCRVGENWWYRREHCEEYVSEPLVVGIAIASVAGFLLVASGVIFFLARTLRDQYNKDESEDPIRGGESLPSVERATKYNPMYESEATTGYSHYYRHYPETPVFSSAEASTDFSSDEIRHIYENSELTKEEIQDRIRIVELYAKDRQFADFVWQHQAVLDTHRENSST
ncbi:hypothetical protein LDENG_00029420 [Lucifuga dentata]|nr:hypothetical protein LDENG_00029420 [Lucifuga dentata]